MENTPKSSTPQSDKEAIYLDACKKNGYYPTSNEKHTAFEAMESYSASQNEELKKQNDEWKEECERLAKVADFWQTKYYELNPPHRNPKIDNL